MVTFRNNNNNLRRNNFRRADRTKFGSNYANNENFKRKGLNRNNHNASKLIEKYNDLAREASSSGDKILSENYFQHADHFTRILNEQENYRKTKFIDNKKNELNSTLTSSKNLDKVESEKAADKTEEITKTKEIDKNQPEAN